MEKGIYMTEKEVRRTEIFIMIGEGRLSQVNAAKELNLSLRQIQRLYKAYKILGIKALCSQKRGRPSNHKLPDFLVARIKELISCEIYTGFGPTFMGEKLLERHGIKVSRETLRHLMSLEGIWRPCNKKRPAIHQQRQRRARYGELLQIDGSPHAWFEDRGEKCVLLVFIDDATGHTFGKFFESETSAAYMATTREYITKYGKPLSLYSDKHGIFRINKPGCIRKENFTQFGRAVEELEIKLICANSPQAKGRVERANQTLQDRLVKELRLAKINTIEEANRFLEIFWADHNRRFAVTPANQEDAHRQIGNLDLNKILCEKHYRKISKNLEISFENTIYQIMTERTSRELMGAQVSIIKTIDGALFLEYKGKSLAFKKYSEQVANGEEVTSKEIEKYLKKQIGVKISKKPARHHKWNQEARALARRKRANILR
jgi:transposase